jgi:UDP-N-acetylglucosamine 4-epimerase
MKPLYGPERKGDVRHSDADITRALRFLNYEPVIDASKGLELAVRWFRENL